ncbi:hypothetical protein GCM10027418_00300 [Mariniluteicoccus endophyticus]
MITILMTAWLAALCVLALTGVASSREERSRYAAATATANPRHDESLVDATKRPHPLAPMSRSRRG